MRRTRRVAPAFVTTIAVLASASACKKTTRTANPPPPEPTIMRNPPDPEPATRKRKRTVRAKLDWNASGGRAISPRPLNPRDASGREIFVRTDDVCVVHDTSAAPKTPLPPGVPYWKNVPVDCPPETDDPAWDHCPETLMASSDGKCFCYPVAGNPPPPPRLVDCPASVKKD